MGCVINDPLAVAYFIDESICEGFKSFTAVETEGLSRGQTLVDRYEFWQKPANSKIMTKVDTRFFPKVFNRSFKCTRRNDYERFGKVKDGLTK